MNQNPSLIPSQQSLWLEKKHNIMRQLLPEELARLYLSSIRVIKEPGEILWIEDAEPKVYILDQGYLRICQTNQDGKRLIIAILGPADFFGHIAPEVSTFGAEYCLEVVRRVRIIVIEAAVFQEVLQNHPDMTMQMVKLLDERHKNLEKRLSSLLLKDLYARLAELLVELAIKYGEPCSREGLQKQDIQMTHQELADFMGIARPTISSILSEFSQYGLVDKHNQRLCVTLNDKMEAVIQHGAQRLSV